MVPMCVLCGKDVGSEEKSYNCDGCSRSLHVQCSGLTASELKCMELRGGRRLKFFCQNCESSYRDALDVNVDDTTGDDVKSELKVTKVQLSCSERLISKLETTISDKEQIIRLLLEQKTNSSTVETCIIAGSTQKPRNSGPNSDANKRTKNSSENKVRTTPEKVPAMDKPSTQNERTGDIKDKTKKVFGTGSPANTGTSSTKNLVKFQAAPKQALIHLGRVALKTKAEEIMQHMTSTFSRNDFVVEACPVRENARSMSFKIEADYSLLDELYKGENWPSGVTIARYKLFRESKTAKFGK